MRHFHRTTVDPDRALAIADEFFPTIGLTQSATAPRTRTFAGPLGTLTLTAKMEGGHATFLEAHTDQVGESRLDRNVKAYFVRVHTAADPRHQIEAAY
jgi:hypothetical protein